MGGHYEKTLRVKELRCFVQFPETTNEVTITSNSFLPYDQQLVLGTFEDNTEGRIVFSFPFDYYINAPAFDELGSVTLNLTIAGMVGTDLATVLEPIDYEETITTNSFDSLIINGISGVSVDVLNPIEIIDYITYLKNNGYQGITLRLRSEPPVFDNNSNLKYFWSWDGTETLSAPHLNICTWCTE